MINEKLFESLVRDYGDECVRITQNLIDKAYQSGRADAIAEFKDLGKLYSEIRADAFDEVIDLYNEMRGSLATNVYEFGERLKQLKEK